MEHKARRGGRQKHQLKQFTVQTRVHLDQRAGASTTTSRSGEEDPTMQALTDSVMQLLLESIERYSREVEAKTPPVPLISAQQGGNGLLDQRQLNLDRSLQLSQKEVQRLEQRLSEAMMADKMFVVLHCFTLVHHQYRLYEGAQPYEQLSNEHALEEVTPNQLALEMMRHEWHYRELLQRCRYLQHQRRPPLQYVLYRRAITLLDQGQPLHNKTPFYQSWFQPHRTGFYYALTVNFGLSSGARGDAHCDESI